MHFCFLPNLPHKAQLESACIDGYSLHTGATNASPVTIVEERERESKERT